MKNYIKSAIAFVGLLSFLMAADNALAAGKGEMCGFANGAQCTCMEVPSKWYWFDDCVDKDGIDYVKISLPAIKCVNKTGENLKCCRVKNAAPAPVPANAPVCKGLVPGKAPGVSENNQSRDGHCVPSTQCSNQWWLTETSQTPVCKSGQRCCADNKNRDVNNPDSGGSTEIPPTTGGGPGSTEIPPNDGNTVSIDFVNPLGDITDVNSFANQILGYLQGVVVVIAVIFIVIGGIMYITSAGNDSQMTRAKDTITAALIGIAVILLAPSFLKEIVDVLGGSSAINTGPITGASSVTDIANRVLKFLLLIVGVLSIIGLVIGGGMYMMAMGDERRADKAKNIIKGSIIGIIVAFAALLIVREIVELVIG